MKEPRIRVSLRIPESIAARAEALRDRVLPRGVPSTPTDLYLVMVVRGIEALEEKARAVPRRQTAPTRPPIPDDDGWVPPED